jgi:hypothetical protein
MRTSTSFETMTYRTLDVALARLGFTRSEVPHERAVLYRHADSDASIILSLHAPTANVQPLDLNTVRKTVVEKGVATENQYAAAVRAARRTARGIERAA